MAAAGSDKPDHNHVLDRPIEAPLSPDQPTGSCAQCPSPSSSGAGGGTAALW